MDDLGAPTSYLAARTGVPVYDATGERIGTLEHLLADDAKDIFEGLLIDTGGGRDGLRYADGDQVQDLYERGAVLKVPRDALHEPSESPAVMGVTPDDTTESDLTARLRRAWDWISGRY